MIFKAKTLQQVLADEIRDLHSMEMLQLKAYGQMARAASSADLQRLFYRHLEQTKSGLLRIERVAKSLGVSLFSKKSEGMMGLLADLSKKVESPASSARDIQLVCLAQKMSHYKWVGYSSGQIMAGLLGLAETMKLLQMTLDDETQSQAELGELGTNFNPCVAFERESRNVGKERKAS